MLSTIDNASEYQTFEIAKQNTDEEFHVVGNLVKLEQMNYDPIVNPNLFTFYLSDTTGYVSKVVYNNTKPQDFERSERIVVKGKMKEDCFEATEILTKCPSKYEDDKIEIES